MAKKKYAVNFAPVREEIFDAKKKLKALRPHVGKREQRRIDLDIRVLNRALATIRPICFIRHLSPKKKKK